MNLRFGGAYPLETSYGRDNWSAKHEMIQQTLQQKIAAGKKVEVLQYFTRKSDNQPTQGEPYLGTIENRDFWWESKVRLGEFDPSASNAQLVWLEDDENGNDATEAKTHFENWLKALGEAQKRYEALNVVGKIKRHFEEKVLFKEFVEREKFYRVDPAIRETLRNTLQAIFEKSLKSPKLTLHREDSIHWKRDGKTFQTTLMKPDRY